MCDAFLLSYSCRPSLRSPHHLHLSPDWKLDGAGPPMLPGELGDRLDGLLAFVEDEHHVLVVKFNPASLYQSGRPFVQPVRWSRRWCESATTNPAAVERQRLDFAGVGNGSPTLGRASGRVNGFPQDESRCARSGCNSRPCAGCPTGSACQIIETALVIRLGRVAV